MKLVTAVLLVGFGMISSSWARSASRVDYRNPEFGIYTIVSQKACFPEAPEHNHGFIIPLDPSDTGCGGNFDRAFLSVVGDYNAFEAPNAQSLLEYDCHWEHGRLSAAPVRLFIRGHASVSGLCTLAGNWVKLVVISQTGKASFDAKDPDRKMPNIYITVTLHTPLHDLARNLPVLKAQLKALRITDPQQDQ